MSDQSPIVEQDPDLEHYLVHSRIDILPVLHALVEQRIAVTVHVEGIDRPLCTRLLSVRPEYEELVFDAAGVSDLGQLDGRHGLKAEAMLEYMQIVFSSLHVEPTMLRGQAAFRACLPQAIARIQRRSSVRYPVPSLNPPVCTVRLRSGESVRRLRIMDISLGGVSVMLYDPKLAFEVGTTLAQCSLELPGIGAIEAELEIRYVTQLQTNDSRLMGCRFANLPLPALTHLRSYVSKLERARLNAGGQR